MGLGVWTLAILFSIPGYSQTHGAFGAKDIVPSH